MGARAITKIARAVPTSDGAGVRLNRVIGTQLLPLVDPFLLLDHFGTDRPQDYIAGFPDHPHRGFETVTYMIEGQMEHRDSVGNRGLLTSGSLQWMTAGRGIIHSEMPKQVEGRMSGFQLWVNLRAKDKMMAPRYQDIPPADVPVVEREGVAIKVLAGTVGEVEGPVQGVHAEPLMLDVSLPAGGRFEQAIPAGHGSFVYAFEGAAIVEGQVLEEQQIGVLGDGDRVAISSEAGARVLVLAGRPTREPVARYGPFVMNTRAELEQAFADYRNGTLAT
jgi:redox-sensitive bicupin YhaK (pirin superfamily)